MTKNQNAGQSREQKTVNQTPEQRGHTSSDLRSPSPQSGEGGSRKRPPFERMKKIFGRLQDGKYPNCSTIAAEFAVSAKTAKRDIDFMRDRWELPIEYDHQKYGYYFTKPVERFPGVPVTEKELFALCVANKAIEQYQGTALQQPLELAFQKCMGQLDDQERFTLQNLDEVMSFRPFAPEDADLRLFELITEAIRERRGLQFEYRKPGEKVAEVRRVNPYHLMQFNNRWYLLAHDPKLGLPSVGEPAAGKQKSTIRKFVLGRMRVTQLTEDRFQVPKDFDAKKFFDHSLGVMTGAGDYEVVIELDAWLTDVLRGRRWHPSQVWTELPGGGSHLRMRLSCLEEIEQWVLSWGTRATVLQPTALRERLFKTTEELWQRYGGPCILHESAAQRV
jgi:predicted DNA-binding transcriptional regulator YafY